MLFCRALNFHNPATGCQDKIGIGFSRAVFIIIKVCHRLAVNHTTGNSRHLIAQGHCGYQTLLQEGFQSQRECYPRPGNGCGARTAIGANNIAIDFNLPLTQFFQINNRPQGAADQTLDFLCTPGLLAARGFSVHAAMGGSRQHTIFSRHPALICPAQKRRDFFIHRSGANHMSIAYTNQAGTFCIGRKMRLYHHVAKGICAAAI